MSKYVENHSELLYWSLEHQVTGSENWDYRPMDSSFQSESCAAESSMAMLVSAPVLF